MMKKTLSKMIIILLSSLFFYMHLYGQGKPYEGPDDPAADIAAMREGFMTGNRVLLRFLNNGQLAGWPPRDYSKWPNDYTGLRMINTGFIQIGTKVYLKNNTIPVDDPEEIKNSVGLDTLFYVQSWRDVGMDKNSSGTIYWGLYPVFGYFDETSDYVAISNRPESWPPLGWPSRGDELKWPGEWDGRFGRNIMYADQETYFIANDAHDQEYLGSDDVVKYYPRPGVFIGDKRPDVTIQKGSPWGGVGIRLKARGYQWNNIQARDVIFWEYDISNISDYNLTECAFSFYIDSGHEDEIGYFNTFEDMAYIWDYNGIGAGGLVPGVMGVAFLESPGLPYDGIDNDDDGLTDEQRDNYATALIGPTDGITDLDKFLIYYNKTVEDLREHWDSDEDQDWMDGDDLNGNGIYDNGENPGDDVGLDGVGPGELNYYGPDEGECNHMPDFLEGYGCEPNFALTDISESDMIGLTSFHMMPGKYSLDEGAPQRDRSCYNIFATPDLEVYTGEVANLFEMFGSGVFPLYKGRTERFSIGFVHAYEEHSSLMSSEHLAPSLFQKKRIAQYIYESDYRFASPPKMPTLKATAGDGKVILTWDDAAEKYTREPMLANKNDFEGYKLYKATDKYFSDAEILVDMYGNPIGKKPIFQCDLKDGIKGGADFALINGEAFYLGDDSGIQHFFVDENVQNGRTYYYGIVAYDYGIKGESVNITPSENNLVIELDEQENVRHIGKNIQIVTPHQQAAGYIPPSIEIEAATSISGDLPELELLDIHSVNANHTYKVKFLVDTLEYVSPSKRFRSDQELYYINNGFAVYDVTSSDSLIYLESPDRFSGDNLRFSNALQSWYLEQATSDPIDGVQLKLTSFVAPEFDSQGSGWIIGDAPLLITPLKSAPEGKPEVYYFPWEYEIVFTANDSAYTGLTNDTKAIKNLNGVLIGSDALLNQAFNFYVINKSFQDTSGEYIKVDLVGYDEDKNGVLDLANDIVLAGHTFTSGSKIYWGGTVFGINFKDAMALNQMPKANDVYRVNFRRAYSDRDSLVFKVVPEIAVEKEQHNSDMAAIKVVPNPYVATNAMESAVSNPYLNQPRRLMFTHIPARCTIKIFTSSGVYIDEIKVEDNPPDNGIVHWDMLTKEGLEIAAGIYLYHIKSTETGKEKLGKFAVIK
jgi:hypothetical protein